MIEVLHPGLQTLCCTTPDFRRLAYGGVAGGAVDEWSYRLANLLCHNSQDAMVLESGFPAPMLRFKQDCTIAITGANFSPEIAGFPVPMSKPVQVQANTKLYFSQPLRGNWTYIAVGGGISPPEHLNNTGDFTPLKCACQLGLKSFPQKPLWNDGGMLEPQSQKPFSSTSWKLNFEREVFPATPTIPLLKNSHSDDVSSDYLAQCLEDKILITAEMNRTGIRLQREHPIPFESPLRHSFGVLPGAVQILPNGNLIVLGSHAQTTGGYPLLGYVPRFWLPALFQLPVLTRFQFSLIDPNEAETQTTQILKTLTFIETALAHI